MLEAYFLIEVRKKAIRGRVWFKSLDRLERSIINLSSKVLDHANKISCLGLVLSTIIVKIEDALKSVFERRLESYGLRRSGEIVELAVKFGNNSAREWLDDSFTRYVTFMSLNMPIGWSF
jgi:hypothetical protein